MTTEQKTAVHQCRDCQAAIAAPKVRLCARCRAAVVEKRKARKREKEHARYRTNQKLLRTSMPKLPQLCAATGCRSLIEGQAYACASCRRAHQRRQHNYDRDNLLPPDEDTPPEPPTSLAWLANFHAWTTSGLSYAAYQKQEWLAKENAAAIHKNNIPD